MRTPLSIAACLVLACSSPAAPVTAPAPGITLALADATVADAVSEVARAGAAPIVIDPSAAEYASCARVTLLVPAPRPLAEVEGLLTSALAPSGFTLAHGPHGLTLSHAGGPPAGCAPEVAEVPEPALPHELPTDEVQRGTDTEIEIERSAMVAWQNDPAEVTDAVRVVPNVENGVTTGLRLFGIRAESPAARLGLMNGDTVHSVNGHPISDPNAMLETYALLRDQDEYRVELTRRGERMTHVIRVVGERGP